ncbi:hypothetical protein GBN23_06385 [Plesiomonas shigelloides]|uniref:DUF334 domain-containing protein n=1 Tax=Plesiomonas shigelloides TaxID=703 RepID=UPI0012619B98|nr:DUF334 domain-containing protein [Plesiomonas shigelloides]KAB7680420.1 hypothetical protein GBN23_06385 [Plesiomonas shigelloides]
MTKQWVFIELVKDDNDLEGLISYAIYKHRKNELALAEKAKGKTESEIDSAVRSYHNAVLASQSMQKDFREKAVKIIDVAVSNAIKAIVDKQKSIHDSKIRQLEKKEQELSAREKKQEETLKKERQKVRNEELAKIRQAAQNHSKENLVWRFLKWLGSGLSGIISTTLVVIFSLGLMSLLGSDAQKQQLTQHIIEALVSLFTTPPING